MARVMSWCRACEGVCGVELEVSEGRIRSLSGDTANPKSAGHTCAVGSGTLTEPHDEGRPLTPLKREGDKLVPCSWEEAAPAVAAAMDAARAKDPRGLALYLGDAMAHDQLGAIRAAAVALSVGTPNLFTTLCNNGASKLRAAELVLGTPMPLQADVGRAHYTLLVGADQDVERWGPLQAGTIHAQAMNYFHRRRKDVRIVAADPRRSSGVEQADEHLAIKPGTELYLLLGLANAALLRGWTDRQYLDDYCTNVDALARWLEPWTPARCAEICGVEPSALSGVALRLSRAAMGTVVLSRSALNTRHATLTAWAWLVVHALTANLLRPGGLFEAQGLIDLQPILATLPSERAPTTRLRGLPGLLLQAPATLLPEELRGEGEGRIKGLVVLGGCPVRELPDPEGVRAALGELDTLVVIDDRLSATAAMADWVLPAAHFWERPELHLLDHSALPSRLIQATPAALPAAGEALPAEEILRRLHDAMSLSIRLQGPWGRHLQLMARYLASAELGPWVDRVLDWARLPPRAELEALEGALDQGELDRATWRVTHEHGRLDLAPEPLAAAVGALSPPSVDPDLPLLLQAGVRWPGGVGWRHRAADAEDPGVRVPPSLGIDDGTEVELRTAFGSLRGVAKVDDTLRDDAVAVPWGWRTDIGRLIDPEGLDPFTGTPDLAGVPCALEIKEPR